METEIGDFLHFMVVDKLASHNTLSAYRADLTQFQNWLSRQGVQTWLEVTSQQANQYAVKLQEDGWKEATVARKIAAIKSFLSFLAAEDQIPTDLPDQIHSVAVQETSPVTLTKSEIDNLTNFLSRNQLAETRRNLALLQLMLTTGPQITEVVSLNLGDVELDSYPYRVHYSTRKGERCLIIPEQTKETLLVYLWYVRPRLIRQRSYQALFVNRRGERLTRQGVGQIFKEVARGARVDPNRLTPRNLRSTFARGMFDQGKSLSEIGEKLGHASTWTTRRFKPAV